MALSLSNLATFGVLCLLLAFGEARAYSTIQAASLMSALLGSTLTLRLLIAPVARRIGARAALLVSTARSGH